uniref:Venom S1 protease with CUB domain 7 n=1 Tax=Platymeris rhadamanthus TaxID=1134088 RepID=A0A6B9L6M2_PLARH|nr:venom S1 protease with CUB domain 7 [Platymeris rhadamanthus]
MHVWYLLVILSSLGCIYGQEVYYKALLPGIPYEDIKSPKYPIDELPHDTSIQWNLVVRADSTIRVLCDDIRMTQNEPWTDDCTHVYLSFDEGNGETKICGDKKGGYQYRSTGPNLFVRLVSKDGSGFVKCTAYNTKELFELPVVLRPGADPLVIEAPPKVPLPIRDWTWTLTSTPGSRISFHCTLALSGPVNGQCYRELLTIDDGERKNEYCKTEKLVVYSSKNLAKIRVQLNENNPGSVRCLVQDYTKF